VSSFIRVVSTPNLLGGPDEQRGEELHLATRPLVATSHHQRPEPKNSRTVWTIPSSATAGSRRSSATRARPPSPPPTTKTLPIVEEPNASCHIPRPQTTTTAASPTIAPNLRMLNGLPEKIALRSSELILGRTGSKLCRHSRVIRTGSSWRLAVDNETKIPEFRSGP